jgi:hypothetical protein
MEPLKPEAKDAILRDRPQASPADIEEYEQLLAARFAEPPPPAAALATEAALKSTASPESRRLMELHAKLFGPQ